MSSVSVPCRRCTGPIGFGVRECPKCGATVDAELQNALGDRLEATSAEFRALRNRLRETTAILVAVGALRILLSALVFALSGDDLDSAGLALLRSLAVFDAIVGAGILCSAWFVRQYPRRVAISVFAAWGITQALVLLIAPLQFLMGTLGKLFAAALLARCVMAAASAEDLRRRLTSGSVDTASAAG
jgi:hypothetical protein